MLVYKVFHRHDGGQLWSPFVLHTFRLKYAPGEWTSAEPGKLFCFTTAGAALEFLSSIKCEDCDLSYEVWVCEAIDVSDPPDKIPHPDGLTWPVFHDFWEKGRLPALYCNGPFPGTVVVRALKPLHKLPVEGFKECSEVSTSSS